MIERKCHDCKRPAISGKALCQPCVNRRKARYEKNGADKQRTIHLRRAYGITLEEKKRMYEQQQGLCLVCGKSLPEDFRKAHVDHNHVTDEVRGLLHQRCNIVVGYLESELVEQARLYLQREN